jgi:hypothetical protein
MIKYKDIDASTDMVIATSGSPFIVYNQIISSSAAPNYAVSSTKSFKDPKSKPNL